MNSNDFQITNLTGSSKNRRFGNPNDSCHESKKMKFTLSSINVNKIMFTVCVVITSSCFSNYAAAADPAEAKSSLVRAMDKVADKVVSVLGELERGKQVIIGDFISRGKSKSSGGIEIRRQLTECLESKGVSIYENGDDWTEISGFYKVIEAKENHADDFNSLGIDITIEFYDENADALKINNLKADGGHTNEIGIPVFGDDAIELGGVSYDVTPDTPYKEKQQEIIEQYHTPVTHADGTQVRGKGPFGVEILVRENGSLTPRHPEFKHGNAFVELHQGEEYVVRVYNDAEFPITAGLKIDGVNAFVDSQDVPKNARRIVRQHKRATFQGWYIHTGKKQIVGPDHQPLPSTKAFLISGYENSVAHRENHKASNVSIGMISVDIRAAWPKGSPLPPGEPVSASKSATRGLATGQGKALDLKYEVTKDLELSKHTRAVIHVRYSK